MKRFNFLLSTLVLLNYFANNVLANNHYYIVSIRRNSNDASYDLASESVKNAIDELVNDRMNDIYNIIEEKKETYRLDNGQMDEKLDELESYQLIKRHHQDGSRKFKFINKNRPDRNNFDHEIFKRQEEKEEIEYIPIESNLVNHIAPVSNYYAIRVYLSDEIVGQVKQLRNVISVGKSVTFSVPDNEIDSHTNKTHSHSTSITNNNDKNTKDTKNKDNKENTKSDTYYDIEEIKRNTGWSDVSIQENASPHLSIISQGRYRSSYGESQGYEKLDDYDENYYYPSTAGKGIDIYIIDDGIFTDHDDFDRYEGTPDERTIKCHGFISDSVFRKATKEEEKRCLASYQEGYPSHGIRVASSAAGTLSGSAKKANIHMLATDLENYDQIVALDYIKNAASDPSKTIINISRGTDDVGSLEAANVTNDKINELAEAGFIIFVSAGNEGLHLDILKDEYPFTVMPYLFSQLKNVIAVGGIDSLFNYWGERVPNMESAYNLYRYSNNGPSVTILAPFECLVADYTNCMNKSESENCHDYATARGTSFSSPLVAGVAALIMAEHPDIKYNVDKMKETLIDMSLKNVIFDRYDTKTPNRLINNGKTLVYDPRSKNPSSSSFSTTIYFEKPNQWNGSNIRAYLYYQNGSLTQPCNPWPGVLMSTESNHSNIYSVKTNHCLMANRVIFNDGSNQSPGFGQDGYEIKNLGLYSISGYVKPFGDESHEGDHEDIIPSNKITIYYYTNWNPAYIHYQYGSDGWTVTPGKPMNTYKNGYQTITFDNEAAATLTFVFNDNHGHWDNNDGKNYKIVSSGSYIIKDKQILSGSI